MDCPGDARAAAEWRCWPGNFRFATLGLDATTQTPIRVNTTTAGDGDPTVVGAVAGLFFGFAFGMAGIGAVVLGELADVTGIQYVFQVCSFLPVIGLLAGFLPHLETESRLQTVAVDMTGKGDAVPPGSAK